MINQWEPQIILSFLINGHLFADYIKLANAWASFMCWVNLACCNWGASSLCSGERSCQSTKGWEEVGCILWWLLFAMRALFFRYYPWSPFWWDSVVSPPYEERARTQLGGDVCWSWVRYVGWADGKSQGRWLCGSGDHHWQRFLCVKPTWLSSTR